METKDLNQLFNDIKKIIVEDNLTQQVNNIKRSIESLKNTEFYQELQKIFMSCEYNLKEAREMVEKAINAPIYAGVIGHYSHGKSSLLNAMLLNQDDKEDGLLPIGDGVVTGMPTLIQFKDDNEGHEFYMVYPDGSDESISEEQYKQLVTQRGTTQITNVKYFRIRLSAKKLAGGGHIFKNMANNNIELLDTPGLGGPYWKDKEALREWVEEFKLLILCIKSTEINQRVADQVNPFLKLTSNPVIVTLTFWDKWKDGEDYSGIKEEYDARKKAKDLIIRYFPTLENCVEEDRIIFCSAKGYFQDSKMTLSKGMEEFFTEQWNIDNVRNVLSNYVTLKKIDILKSSPSKTSFLAKSKKEGVLKSGDKLLRNYKDLRDKLLEISDKLKPSPKIFKDIKEKFLKKAKDELQTLLHNEIIAFESQFQKELKKQETPPETLVENYNNDFRHKINKKIKEYNNTLQELTEKEIIKEIERYVKREKTAINPEQIDELENEIKEDIIKDFIEELNNFFNKTNIFVLDNSIIDIERAKDNLNIFVNGIKKYFLLPIIGIACLILSIILMQFGKIDQKIVISTLIITCISILLPYFIEKWFDTERLKEEKRKRIKQLIKDNSKEELEKRLNKVESMLEDRVTKIYDLIDNTLGSAQGEQSETIKQIKSMSRGEGVTSIINNLELILEELKQMK